MKRELDSIANFLTHRVRLHNRQKKKKPIPDARLRKFNQILARLLRHPTSFRGWFMISQLQEHPSVTCAAELSNIAKKAIYESFDQIITITVDQGEVNFQVGIGTNFDTLYLKDHYRLGLAWRPSCYHLECCGECQSPEGKSQPLA